MLDRKPFDKSYVIAVRQKHDSGGKKNWVKVGNTERQKITTTKKREREREDITQETKQANI